MKSISLLRRLRSSLVRERIFSLIAIVGVLALIAEADFNREQQPVLVLVQQQTSQDKQGYYDRTIERKNEVQSNPQETELQPPTRKVNTTDLPKFNYPDLDQIEEIEILPPAEAINWLQPMLLDSDPVIRLAALESLATMNFSGIPSILTAALPDPNPLIRIEALEALALQGDATSIAGIEPYLYDHNREVRIAAVDSLSELETEEAVIALAGLLSDGDVLIRHHTVNALGEIGGDNAVMYLLQARYDPDESIRENVETILFELNHKDDY